MLTLRPYQHDAIARLRDEYAAGRRAPLLVLPTGAGKTVVFSAVTAGASERGRSVLILAHRTELIRQASTKLRESGVPHGIIAPGFSRTLFPVQVASVQTMARRLGDGRYPAPDLIVIDEAHHAVAGQWAKVAAAYPTARLLGVTATPERLDGRGLGTIAGGPFDSIVIGPMVADLIAAGFLTPSRVFAPSTAPDLSAVRTVRGDFSSTGLAMAMSAPTITGDAVDHYSRLAPGLPAIAFCASVDHARTVAAQFSGAGWRAVAVSGADDRGAREAAISGLANGRVQVLAACDLISEGLDVPAVGAVILLRPTQSLGLHLQQIGRGLRPAPGKSALIVLDHAGNTLRHGFAETPREWTLAGRKKRDRTAVAVRQCPTCYACHAPAPRCPECGHEYAAERTEREGPRAVAGQLAEVDREADDRLRSAPLPELLRSARTRDDVEAIRRAKGYKPGWTHHIMAARASRRPESAAA